MNSNEGVRSHASSVPSAAAWLGGLGIIAFAGLLLATPFAIDGLKAQLSFALMAYGAITLSFLGGTHWGLAIGEVPKNHNTLWPRIALSILPSLVAWVALLTSSSIGFLVLAAAFVAMLVVDIRASRMHEAPAWYPKLRWPLSCGAVAAFLLGTFS
ncbi:MAG: DUF3429 domain-containing protein [Xanthobacteraceae bacterium]|nr:DUF3429 domain-containing protein [Xanthobacteraceae bacterium]